MRLNGPGAVRIPIPSGTDLLYDDGTLVFTEGFTPSSIPVNRYQYLLQSVPTPFAFQEFTSGSNTGEEGPGTLFYDGETAFFTDSQGVVSFIDSLPLPVPIIPTDPPVPLPQVEILTVRRGSELVLNLDESPDGNAVSTDDRIELTGSEVFRIESGESLTYRDNTIRYRRGSVTQSFFDDIDNFLVLEDVTRNGESGRRLREFSGSSNDTGIFTGPGVLRIGEFQGQNVGFYSTSQSANQEILSESVNRQLNFTSQPETNTAQVSDIFTVEGSSTPLIELIGARTATYPTATQVNFNNGEVTVGDRFGQRLARISGVALNGFINNEISRLGPGESGSFAIPSGGVTLIENGGQAFIYPSRNSIISAGIAGARASVVEPQPQGVQFSFQGLPSGGAVLSGDGQELVTVTSGTTVDLSDTQSFAFDGSTVSVFNQGSPGVPFASFPVSSLSVSESPTSLLTFDSTTPLNRDVSGPGRLYVDDQNRAFFTNSQRLQNGVTSFINTLPPARVVTRRRTVNGSNIVNLENDNRRLVEVSSSTTTDIGPRQGVIYSGNRVTPVNGFRVRSSSSVVYNPVAGTTEVRSADGTVTFSTSASPFSLRQGGIITQPTPTGNTTYQGGGILYFDPTGNGGALYSDDDTVDSNLVSEIETRNFIADDPNFAYDGPIDGINQFTTFDGRQIRNSTGSLGNFLSGPGTVYSSVSDGQAFYSADIVRNSQIPGEVSQQLPVSVPYNSTTGGISVISGNGESVFNFTVSNIKTGRVSRTGTVTYSNGVISAPTVFGTNITGVTRLTTFNGFETRTFGPDDEFTFTGPGQILIDEDTGEALFTSDETTTSRINQRIQNVIDTFVGPVIRAPSSRTLTSKFNNVDATFGQVQFMSLFR